MASVSSLDKDMRNIRLSKYTSQAANEVRTWIEDVLGERLAQGDLLDALKDGTALCKLVNLAAPPGVRFKESSMPFVQMENISHFLRACQSAPLNLQSHDIFQTVDLYESKDPAQVLQCIAAFSRRAHAVQPSKFTSNIGEKSRIGVVSPQSTGGYSAASNRYSGQRQSSGTSEASSTASRATSHQASLATGGRRSPSRVSETSTKSVNGGVPASSSGNVSSWSKRTDEGTSTPAWNIHQYGYMGGASQGNQGITFGGRRQITTPAPKVPSLAEKERKRREQEAEDERLRLQAEEVERKRRVEREAEEERERLAEEQRWEKETKRQREQERLRVEEEKRRWEVEERKWKEEEEAHAREEREAEVRFEDERHRKRAGSDARLQGQFLSQYQAEQKHAPSRPVGEDAERLAERERVRELERELEKAKEREAQYERERQERLQADQMREQHHQQHHPHYHYAKGEERDQLERHDMYNRQKGEIQHDRPRTRGRTTPSHTHHHDKDLEQENERDYLREEWSNHHDGHGDTKTPRNSDGQPPPRPLPTHDQPPQQPQRPLPSHEQPPRQPPRPLPNPTVSNPNEPSPTPSPPPPFLPSRPLPNPATYASTAPTSPRKSPFARPQSPQVTAPSPSQQPQPQTQSSPPPTAPAKNPPFAKPSSLLSREMELDRSRQQEWEEAQKATAAAADGKSKTGEEGPAWDVNQYGYLGGDSQNRGGTGIGFGGRRQLVGPREPRGKS